MKVAEQDCKSNDGWRASTAWTLSRDERMKVRKLGSRENFVDKWEELVFDEFSDAELEWTERKMGVIWQDLGALTSSKTKKYSSSSLLE